MAEFTEEDPVELKEAIDIQELIDPKKGTEFEVDVSKLSLGPEAEPTNKYFPGEEVYHNLLNVDDETADICDREGLGQFEVMMRTMEDVTQGKDEGVYKKMLEPGAGPVVPQGSLVRVHYNAYHEMDAEPFDSTRLRNQPHSFRLGIDGSVEGLHVAVATMKKGEKSRFIFKPEYYFGELGCPPRIPPNCTVLFEVEVLSFVERQDVDDFNKMTEDEKKQVTFEFIWKVSKQEREEGNQLFNNGIYSKALSRYGRAARVLEDYSLKNEEEEHEMQKVMVKILLNMAICCLKMKHNGTAITYCNRVLKYDPRNIKAFFRKAQALHSKSEFEQAREMYRQAQTLDATNADIRNALKRLEQDIKRFKTQDDDFKNMCQKMLSKSGAVEEAPKAKETGPDLEKEIEECSDRFWKVVTEKLEEFKRNQHILECPFPEQSLTPAEISCILEVADSMDMKVQRKGTGNSSRMVVVKTKKLLEFE